MCQIKNGELFKLKREKVNEFEVLFYKIRLFRDSGATEQCRLLSHINNGVKRNIISAIGRDELVFAKLIYRRAKIAGLPL
ncbi:hypothetical protein ACU8V4_06280 [Pseudoalteromonas mariniglutinosa]